MNNYLKYVVIVLFVFIFLIFISFSLGLVKNNYFNKINVGNFDKEIMVNASNFEFNPGIIIVDQGDKVRIVINNLDGLHGIRIPDLDISGNEIIDFEATQKGEFEFYCANYCGRGHKQMKGKLVIN